MSPAAFPTKLCNVDASGNLDPHDCLVDCGPGWYCPNVRDCAPFNGSAESSPWSLRPEYCPPTIGCATQRLGSAYCDAAQGEFEPLLCPPGNFCPDTHTMVPCPEGTYCMRGSVAPMPCPALSYCPQGTKIRRIYGGVLACALLDLALVALFFYCRDVYEPGVWGRRSKWVMRQFGGDGAVELEDLGAQANLQVRIKNGMRSALAGFGAALTEKEKPLLSSPAENGGSDVLAAVKAAAKKRLFASFKYVPSSPNHPCPPPTPPPTPPPPPFFPHFPERATRTLK